MATLAGPAINRGVPEPPREPISASTRYCAVYGQPIRHSASPAMHNAGLAHLGLDWRYLAFEVRPVDLCQAVAGALTMRFIGLNLTVPHKVLAMDMVDALDDSARTWGAVNTICFKAQNRDGLWQSLGEFPETPVGPVRSHGFNTDADAITRSLREDVGLELAGARVLVLGAGGAGRTAALKLASDGAKRLWLVNRTEGKAAALALEIKERFEGVEVTTGFPREDVDLVLNATSLGLRPDDALPLEESQFSLRRSQAVYDMIYRPAETPLLRAGKAAGCRTANGLGMLLYQGARALEIWTGRPAPVAVMRRALEQNIYG